VTRLLGLDFTDAGLEDVVAWLLARPVGEFGYVVTPNADHLARLRRVPELWPVYRGAMLRLLDSRFLQLWARALGMAVPPVVTGADLTEALLARADGRRVAVVGMTAEGMALLVARFPAVGFVHHAPPMGLAGDDAGFLAARDFVLGAGAEFVFFAVGSPVQERLAAAVAQAGGVGVGLCVGAGLEFCAGTVRRAPGGMRRCGLEWAFRLMREPRRLGWRYLVRDPGVLVALVAEAVGFSSL
jgi:exopolysaccharide biosynthesis WecB/TagA/CpsF family protein